MQYVWHELKNVGYGFKLLYKDFKFYMNVKKKLYLQKYHRPSYKVKVKLDKVKKDFIKFIPFSFFIVVPFAEFLLPAWLIIFPNSIPSQFLNISEEEKNKQLKMKVTETRNMAVEKLLFIMPKYLTGLENDPSIEQEDKQMIKPLKSILKSENTLPTDLLYFRHLFEKYFAFSQFPATTLVYFCNFMGFEPVTGLGAINNILKYMKLNVSLEAPVVRLFTKFMIQRSLNLYFGNIRHEDELLTFENLEHFTDEELNYVCYRRGIQFYDKTYAQKMKDLNLWLSISNLRNVPHSLLLYARIVDYAYQDLFSIT